MNIASVSFHDSEFENLLFIEHSAEKCLMFLRRWRQNQRKVSDFKNDVFVVI